MAIIGTPAQQFVPIREVRDGIMVMKDGTLAMAVLVSSVNLSLKSADEQQATLMQFQNFLNTLDFPIQIVIQSRRYDIRPYILTLQNRLKEQVEPLLQVQTREYIQFIQSFTDQVNIMRKNFFVVVPYIPPILSQAIWFRQKSFHFSINKATHLELQISLTFEEQRTQLEERVSVVEQGLTRVGLRVAQLGTEEVIELLYKTFNPGESTSQASMTS
jgi:hypothetical protein